MKLFICLFIFFFLWVNSAAFDIYILNFFAVTCFFCTQKSHKVFRFSLCVWKNDLQLPRHHEMHRKMRLGYIWAKSESRPRKRSQSRTKIKTTLTAFFDYRTVMFYEYGRPPQSINKKCYKSDGDPDIDFEE